MNIESSLFIRLSGSDIRVDLAAKAAELVDSVS
jgi:hypothetical protein